MLPIFAFLLSKCVIYGCNSKKSCNFAAVKDKDMKKTDATLDQLKQSVEQNGVCVEKERHVFLVSGVDVVFPHVVLLLCLRGTARVMFDMQEIAVEKNVFGILMPGHVFRHIACSEDYAYARVVISAEMVSKLKTHAFSHDSDKYNYTPHCHLTDVQAKRVMALLELLEAIASHDLYDLQLRRQMLLAQLAVGYEFINYYRREQDRLWAESRPVKLYTQFCDLVVEHYKEKRNVNYYAGLMDYDPRYFSKVFRQYSNGLSPLGWIQQYVATQAKLIMDTHPNQTVKETAYQLGFPTTANFCRYFKHATSIYPQEYKKRRG